MPAGEVGTGDVTYFPALNQIVKRLQGFLNWSLRVKAMQRIDVNIIGLEPAQAGFAGANQMKARRPDIIRFVTHPKGSLRGDEYPVPPPGNRFAQDFLRQSIGIDIGGIKQVRPCLQADVNQPPCLGNVAVSPGTEERISPAKSPRAKTEDRDFEARTAEQSEFHVCFSKMV